MQKNIINPWKWQNERSYVQAVEVLNSAGTLYISGQTAIDKQGVSSDQDMRSQLIHTLQNLETVVHQSGYELKNIIRLNIFTTSNAELFENFDVLQDWTSKNSVQQTSTVLEGIC